ncbi:serine/threonine-protein kinase [Hyalangium rubrum]|uniref:Serine/threonine-protein kinase n=1 Tax=Hyalangium rubrum TaxID=3103134 RepID=A0ABU5HC03_9BACT|nr:serine/threonine-protein kinase [Hyalangium sp. s54d21]MDY7230993.1 serine/threonine-protein kinase [Hyalangium sp. s54d21]
MIRQVCPNCERTHDVSVYVSGQRVLCRCGIKFEVRRGDVSTVGSRPSHHAVTVVGGSSAEEAQNGVEIVLSPSSVGDNALRTNGVASASNDGASAQTAGVAPPAQPATVEMVGAATVLRGSQLGAEEAPGAGQHEESGTFAAGMRAALPGFELLRILGRGGMGEVWLARQQSLGRTVAVKLLPPRLAKDPEFVTRFEKEATALAALSHPNIIQIIDRGVAGEHYYFVMEYVEGRSLRDMMGMTRLPAPQGLRLLCQVARAIECAHDKGIIHRDLKPENILVDGRGHVKVADFGLAGIRQPDSRLNLTATAVAMGTLNYMAPEQRKDAKNVDGRADLFSFGVMLYEVLTGELPVGRFRLPSERVPGLDPRVDAVVARLLENEPEDRYATASEVCTLLEAMAGSSPGSGLQSAAGAPGSVEAARSSVVKRLHSGWRSVRAGLSVVGGLIVLGYVVKALIGPVNLHVGGGEKGGVVIGTEGFALTPSKKPWPANTDGELFIESQVIAPEKPESPSKMLMKFAQGEEEMNVWSGTWRLKDGRLEVVQGGSEMGPKGRFLPRAYLAHRYFSSDDFNAEVMMDVRPLGAEYPVEPDAQHFGELTFRIRDLQVSAFAIPDVGMRLSWRYLQEDGTEVVGNSAQDLENLTADEMPVPAKGPFRVRLQMKRRKNGVMVEAFVNGVRFAYKMLPGLEGRVGKVALGCRNQACTFSELTVQGHLMERPKRRVAGAQE